MTSNFIHDFGGCRLDQYDPQPVMDGEADEDSEQDEKVDLSYEGIAAEHWHALDATVPEDWNPCDWPERPTRFIDGKDVGETVAWVRAPGGYPVPIRLGQIGGVAMDVVDQACRRAYYTSEPVVSLVTQPFPWDAVESFGLDLQKHGFRLLPAQPPMDQSVTPPERRCSYDFEKMRKAAQNRCTDEMTVLEQAAIAQQDQAPTVVDGRLEPRSGGFSSDNSPIYGVIKTHRKTYLKLIPLPGQTPRRPGRIASASTHRMLFCQSMWSIPGCWSQGATETEDVRSACAHPPVNAILCSYDTVIVARRECPCHTRVL